MTRPVKFGGLGLHYPPHDMQVAAVQGYEAAGFDFVTWGDQMNMTIPRALWTPDLVPSAAHYDIDNFMDPWIMAGVAAAATERIELGITVVDAIRRLPANLAQMALSIDHISKGRFFFGIAAGEVKQFAPYGVQRRKPITHLRESVKIAKLLMERSDVVDYDGPLWNLRNAILRLEPYGAKPPPLLVAGGPGPSLEIAGRLADGWVVFLPPNGEADWYAAQVQNIKRYAAEAGRDPDELIFYGMMVTVIEETEAEALEMARHPVLRWDAACIQIPGPETTRRWGHPNPLGEDWSYARDFIPTEWTKEQALAVAEQVPPETVLKSKFFGTPESVADQIMPYIAGGMNYVQLLNYSALLNAGDFGQALAKQNLVAQTIEVMRHRPASIAV